MHSSKACRLPSNRQEAISSGVTRPLLIHACMISFPPPNFLSCVKAHASALRLLLVSNLSLKASLKSRLDNLDSFDSCIDLREYSICKETCPDQKQSYKLLTLEQVDEIVFSQCFVVLLSLGLPMLLSYCFRYHIVSLCLSFPVNCPKIIYWSYMYCCSLD